MVVPASLAAMLKARERRARTRRLFIEMGVLVAFVISFFFVSTSINHTDLGYYSTNAVKQVLLEYEDEDEDGDGEDDRRRRQLLRAAGFGRWPWRPRKRHLEARPGGKGASRSGGRRRRLRAAGGGGDEEEASYFDGLLDEEAVWGYLHDALGNALWGEEPLDPVRRDGTPYLLQTQRIIGAIRISQARIASGSADSSDNTDDVTTLSSSADDGGCDVPAIYAEDSLVSTRSGERSTIIIPACYPDHSRILAKWNTSDFGDTRNGTYPLFTYTGDERGNTSLSYPSFVVDIPSNYNLTQWQDKMDELRARGFIDAHTRFLYVSINAYNVATDLFLAIELRFEMKHSGGVWTRAAVRTLSYSSHLHLFFSRAPSQTSPDDLKLLVVEALFLVFLLVSLVMQISQLNEQGLAYLIVPYNWFAFANIILFLVIEVRRFSVLDSLIDLLYDEYNIDREMFLPLFPLAQEAFVTQNLLALNTLLMLTLVFKFLGLSPRLDLLTKTLVLASTEMFWFVLLFTVVLLAYCAAFYLCFGMDVPAFQSISESIFTLLSVLLGQFNFEPLATYNQYLGPFLFWTYVVVVSFLILSSFVAIIEEAFGKAKEDAKSKYDLLANLLSARVRDRLRVLETRGRRLRLFAQKTRSTSLSGSRRLTLRVRDSSSHGRRSASKLTQMTEAMRGVLNRSVGIRYTRPEEERLKRAAWTELSHRHDMTHALMERMQRARKTQCAVLQKVLLQQEQQMAQLEELSTQLWNAWQLVAEHAHADAAAAAAEPRSAAN